MNFSSKSVKKHKLMKIPPAIYISNGFVEKFNENPKNQPVWRKEVASFMSKNAFPVVILYFSTLNYTRHV